MSNSMFENAIFNMGWEVLSEFTFFENNYTITVHAEAYYEGENVTEQQQTAYEDFLSDNIASKNIEKIFLDNKISAAEATRRYTPKMLLIRKNGNYAMLFDDAEDGEDGIVVCIKPQYALMLQDEYI